MAKVRITHRISLDEEELQESFVRASGPGGQHVNKTETAVQLRFDVANSPNLPEDVRHRLMRLAGHRLTQDGVLVLTADKHRSQQRNRVDALERLSELVREASIPPTPRRPTKPTFASKQRRLEGKAKRSEVKQGRRSSPRDD